MLDDHYHEELRALRDLEKTVRAYGVTKKVVSASTRTEMLAVALRAVVDARKSAVRQSRLKSPDKPVQD